MVATSPWRILVADDHPVVRAGLRTLLAADPRCQVVGEAASLAELRTVAANRRPDLIVLDLSFGDHNALQALPDLLATPDAPRIIVLTMHEDPAFARAAFANGAHGYLLKETAGHELIRAVEVVMGGSAYLHAELGARMAHLRPDPARDLSPRERELLALLAQGYTNAEAATRLAVSLRTVESHRANLRARLGVSTRAEIVDAARRLGMPQ